MFDNKGESTPPTKVQNSVISGWVEKKGEVDSIGDSDLVRFDLNVIDGGAEDFPAGVPVGAIEAVADLSGE